MGSRVLNGSTLGKLKLLGVCHDDESWIEMVSQDLTGTCGTDGRRRVQGTQLSRLNGFNAVLGKSEVLR